MASRPDATKLRGESTSSTGQYSVVHKCRSSPQKRHHGDPCVSIGSHTTCTSKSQKSTCSTGDEESQALLVPKRLFEKIQKKRNNLAHGGDVLIADVLDSFQNVQRYFSSAFGKQRDLLIKHLDKIQRVEEGIDVLKKVVLTTSQTALDVYTLPRKHTAASRLFLSVTRPELVGREDVLKRLTILMTPPASVDASGQHSTTCWPRVLLHGPPGIGKTAVVRELSCRLQTSHPHQHSFQATTEMTLLADINLFLKLETQSRPAAPSGQSGQSRFADHLFQTKKSLFLVFEDVTEPHTVMSLLPKNKHCVVFTSSSDHSWKRQQFIPNDVIGVPLPGLGEEDSVLLAAQVLAENGCKQLFRKICRHAAELEHLRRFLSEDMMGFPLAVRLVALQICHDDHFSIDLSAMIEEKLCDERSIIDEKAAGRIHVRGFYHIVRYAIASMSNDMKTLLVSLALSIFKCCGPPLLFLELLLHRLNLTYAEVHVCLERLMKTGLVTQLGEDYSMHQVVQKHVRTIVSSSFKEVKESVMAALLQIFRSETVLSTRVRLSEKAERFACMPSQRCFSAQHDYVCSDSAAECEELTLGSVITEFLDKADSLHLTWKERNTCLKCLLWCHEQCSTRPRHHDVHLTEVVVDRTRLEFMKFHLEIDSFDLTFEDDDTVGDILFARWAFLPVNLVQICADISRQIDAPGKRPRRLITLLHVGGKALLATKQPSSVEPLFLRFGISVNYLIGQFEASEDELFCRCALTIVEAKIFCKDFRQSRAVLFAVLSVWLAKFETSTIDCQEEIIRVFLHTCWRLHLCDRHSQTLELYDVAYAVCNINGYSRYRPNMAMHVCYDCALYLGKSCESNPQAIALQGRVWLHRALFHANMKPRQSVASLELLLGVCSRMLMASATGGRITDETSPLAMDAWNRLLPACISLRKGKGAALALRLGNAVSLMLPSLAVAKLSDLDTELVAVHCRKLAQLISPVHFATVDKLHSRITLFCTQFEFLTSTQKTAYILILQHIISEHPQTIDAILFSRTKTWKGSVKTEPDPAVLRTTIDIFIRELMLCGKCSHAKVLQEAFRLWPCE